ncbi:hypothetical protein ACJX0J_009505, partial [Zea mays]
MGNLFGIYELKHPSEKDNKPADTSTNKTCQESSELKSINASSNAKEKWFLKYQDNSENRPKGGYATLPHLDIRDSWAQEQRGSIH